MTDFTANLARISPSRTGRSLFDYLDLYRQRRALADLSPELLDDIGVASEQANHEAERPVWDAPAHWKQ